MNDQQIQQALQKIIDSVVENVIVDSINDSAIVLRHRYNQFRLDDIALIAIKLNVPLGDIFVDSGGDICELDDKPIAVHYVRVLLALTYELKYKIAASNCRLPRKRLEHGCQS